MRRIILLFLLSAFCLPIFALKFDDLSLGVGCGYESTGYAKGEMYLQTSETLFKKDADFRAGISNRTYKFDFDGVNNLESNSVGVFCDAIIYPFNNGLFTGLRWELINLNWLTTSSKTQFAAARDYTPSSLYSGSSLLLQLGYKWQVADKLGLRLYVQPGIQQFRISNTSTTFGNYSGGSDNTTLISEDHNEFICNVNLSIDFKMK
jgi:hypothetical protein